MANIAIVLSSPRADGNSNALARAVANGAMGLSTNIITIYDLNALKYTYACDHCDACKISHKCKIDDSITPIIQDLAKADVIICSTPLYFGRANSLFYLLIDRMYSYLDVNSQPLTMKGKFIPIITCDEDIDSMMRLQKDLRQTFESLGFKTKDGITYSTHGKRHAVQNDSDILEYAELLGSKLLE